MTEFDLEILRQTIAFARLGDESRICLGLLDHLQTYDATATAERAVQLTQAVRAETATPSLIDTLLHEYQLSSKEGVVLMEIAEALLRIPDLPTQDALLQDKLGSVDWSQHHTLHDTLLVKLLTRALSVTGRIENAEHGIAAQLSRLGSPLIRSAAKHAMQLLAGQFVFAETIEAAIADLSSTPNALFSFDMLGEAALTAADADRYFLAYQQAITHLAKTATNNNTLANGGISVKLSALFPRYEPLQKQHAVRALSETLMQLATQAKLANIQLTIDAEESELLDLSLTVFNNVFGHSNLEGWQGLGLAVQSYQKCALPVIHWLAALSMAKRCCIPLRLVKGAYWDGEIKRAQENGLADYPVFTRKSATDVSYLACAETIFANPEAFYPQFATHNSHTVAALLTMAENKSIRKFEFQRLHGMGECLFAEIAKQSAIPCRVYAPIGRFNDLLPYLVRRLLENGANTSFLSRIENPMVDVTEIVANPIITLQSAQLPLDRPEALFGAERVNSAGLDLCDTKTLDGLQTRLEELASSEWESYPFIDGRAYPGEKQKVRTPANHDNILGEATYADADIIGLAGEAALRGFTEWQNTAVNKRALCLRKAADLFEAHRLELVSLCVREAGRTIKDALAEVREAVDFCRYYAAESESLFGQSFRLPGPTGETNNLIRCGRGAMVCVSPWNFPIAIFTGQIAACLAAGNSVIAKPATQTSLTAMFCIRLLLQAGIPNSVLHYLPANGDAVGRHLLRVQGLGGVVFTGSLSTARMINQTLAQHQKTIVPIIAETGGQNALIADSSARIEQLVQDILVSAFNSAGQRCSALRVLYIQNEIADKTIEMLIGALQQWNLGDPGQLVTDIGPVINEGSVRQLADHVEHLRTKAKVLYQMPLAEPLESGSFFPPTIIEIDSIQQLTEEVFGPVLHVVRFASDQLMAKVDDINSVGYGLTLGIHSRIQHHIGAIAARARVGNIYVNRTQIGAVVGVQPFGGMGLSGTGPKAGGPDYLRRLSVEKTLTVNTAAAGGNADLLSHARF